ncbi:MAG: hypothetical protein ACYSTY_11890, partial [Planctomycetota bacterium]
MSKSTKPKSGPSTSSRRRQELRRNLPKPARDLKGVLRQPEVLNVAVVAAAFFVLASFLVVWSQDQIKVVHGQIMTDNRVTRLDYEVEDELRTEQARRAARERVPHVFRPNTLYLEALRPQLMNLPVVVDGQGSLEAIDPGIRGSFA